jgi:hypothetical protein
MEGVGMTAHHRTPEWSKTTRTIRPRLQASINAGGVACIDCGRPVMPGQRWQVGHVVSVVQARAAGWSVAQMNDPSNLGATHAKGPGQKACNQIEGGKLGAAASNKKRKEEKRFPNW